MIKTLQKHALVMVALLLPISQTASLQAMPTSTKVLIGTTAASVGATLTYGYIIYTKETEKLGKTPTFIQYMNFLKTLVTKSPTRSKITKHYPALTYFVALNATLLIGTTGKLIKDRFADKAEKNKQEENKKKQEEDKKKQEEDKKKQEEDKKKQEEDKKKQEEDKKKQDDEDKRNAALLAPATKPLAQLTAKERGDRKEAQRKAKGEEALSYDPKKASKEVDLDFKRPEAGWTEEEKSPEYTVGKKKLFKLVAKDFMEWEKQMNEADNAGMPPDMNQATDVDTSDITEEDICTHFNTNSTDLTTYLERFEGNEKNKELKILKLCVLNYKARKSAEHARKSTEEYKKKSAEIRERAQEIRKQLEETRKKLNPLYPTDEEFIAEIIKEGHITQEDLDREKQENPETFNKKINEGKQMLFAERKVAVRDAEQENLAKKDQEYQLKLYEKQKEELLETLKKDRNLTPDEIAEFKKIQAEKEAKLSNYQADIEWEHQKMIKEKNKKHLRSLKSEKKHNGFDVPVEVLEPKTKKAI